MIAKVRRSVAGKSGRVPPFALWAHHKTDVRNARSIASRPAIFRKMCPFHAGFWRRVSAKSENRESRFAKIAPSRVQGAARLFDNVEMTMENVAQETAARNSYRADTEPGMAMSMSDMKIISGVRGIVKLREKTVAWSATYPTKAQAMRWATAEAKRFRAYRQQNGEGIEEVQARKKAAEKATRRRRVRMSQNVEAMYDLLAGFVGDFDLVPPDDLPMSAAKRVTRAKEIIAIIDTDTE